MTGVERWISGHVRTRHEYIVKEKVHPFSVRKFANSQRYMERIVANAMERKTVDRRSLIRKVL